MKLDEQAGIYFIAFLGYAVAVVVAAFLLHCTGADVHLPYYAPLVAPLAVAGGLAAVQYVVFPLLKNVRKVIDKEIDV